MADDTDIPGPEDRDKINVGQDWELRDWSKKLGVTQQEIIDAVDEVGVMVVDVKKHLGIE